jgi:hypothetical protein
MSDVEHDVADLANPERQALRALQLLDFLGIECHGAPSCGRRVLRAGHRVAEIDA